MSEGEWTHAEEWQTWNFRRGNMWVSIAKRPWYCDRGHYVANVSGVPAIDGADEFPRYFMDLERAKLELADWLDWRIHCEAQRCEKQKQYPHVLNALTLAHANFRLSCVGLLQLGLLDAKQATWLLALDGEICQRIKSRGEQ